MARNRFKILRPIPYLSICKAFLLRNTDFRLFLVILILSGCNSNDNLGLLMYNHTTKNFANFDSNKSIFDNKKITVICFFSYHCPMSLRQIPYLKSIQGRYSQNVELILVIPEHDIDDKNSFEKADISSFRVLLDKKLLLTKELNATITPQYFVYTNGRKVYSGSLDNQYSAISMPKNDSENYVNYIESTLFNLINKRTIIVTETKPIGCYIEID